MKATKKIAEDSERTLSNTLNSNNQLGEIGSNVKSRFETISDSIDSVREKIANVSSDAEKQKQFLNEIDDSIQTLQNFSQKTADQTARNDQLADNLSHQGIRVEEAQQSVSQLVLGQDQEYEKPGDFRGSSRFNALKRVRQVFRLPRNRRQSPSQHSESSHGQDQESQKDEGTHDKAS